MMFGEMNISNFLIVFLILFLLAFIYLQHQKCSHLSAIRYRCQVTREKLNEIRLSTDVLDQEYYQLKERLSSSSIDDRQCFGNIEDEPQRSLIDQQRIQTLEHLNRQLKNELKTSKLVNETLKKRLNSTSQINNKTEDMIPKIRNNRSYSPSRKSWPFPYLPPWIRPKLPTVLEDKLFENQNPQTRPFLPNFYFGGFPFPSDQSNGIRLPPHV